ncbi:hypothetical protein COC52_24415 [Priestia megaterium]|nr:hypothetical protein CN533_29465 [Priestia megaterium]PFK81890.1 hypothetical protein COJ19_26840 [Priestia megaterium]PGR23372.1 hypothetical protein COC52_24415 [Priestia megaterium]
MWKSMVSYLPEWQVFVRALMAFFIPYIISRLFNWTRTSEEE